ncbi:hypothetical protein XELAEV_18032557mg [Xenopus laevis]|uniref:Secreted protein n=1 Tax=Xenopus laevis TaxID=8355 RepID=A0A974HGN6_XENLA|nr:hypothetical protein XELAEV_18032557mg [Xenopus laevis]
MFLSLWGLHLAVTTGQTLNCPFLSPHSFHKSQSLSVPPGTSPLSLFSPHPSSTYLPLPKFHCLPHPRPDLCFHFPSLSEISGGFS